MKTNGVTHWRNGCATTPDHRWLTQLGTLLATSYDVPLHDYTTHTLTA